MIKFQTNIFNIILLLMLLLKVQNKNVGFYTILFGSSNIEMGKKWYESIIFSFSYAIISMQVVY